MASISAAHELGTLLRQWRSARGMSQLDLSNSSGISQRHISFVESGRSLPSRDLLREIAEALEIPLRERNMLLLAAGYAPAYEEPTWDSPEMSAIDAALTRMLRQHEPFPAVVMDRYWNVIRANESTPRFFDCFIDMSARAGPRNILHLMFDPLGMRPFIANWEQTSRELIRRVHRESVGRIVDERTKELLAALTAYSDVAPAHEAVSAASALPVIPLTFVKDGRELRYFSMITTVGTPQTISAQELRIESMFPADEATERAHVELLR